VRPLRNEASAGQSLVWPQGNPAQREKGGGGKKKKNAQRPQPAPFGAVPTQSGGVWVGGVFWFLGLGFLDLRGGGFLWLGGFFCLFLEGVGSVVCCLFFLVGGFRFFWEPDPLPTPPPPKRRPTPPAPHLPPPLLPPSRARPPSGKITRRGHGGPVSRSACLGSKHGRKLKNG